MKISLALGPRQPLSRQTAWGCFVANLGLPGAGSLAAGRLSGYAQLALAAVGTMLTVAFGTRAIAWYIANWSRLHQPQMDPVEALEEMWVALKWALLGIGIFLVGWLWALVTSLFIVRTARGVAQQDAPPRLQ
jgi:hypothetical protein